MDRFATPFGFGSTADEVIRGVDLAGKHAVVNGGASGIGHDHRGRLTGSFVLGRYSPSHPSRHPSGSSAMVSGTP